MSNKLSDIVNFNPSRILKKGTVAPFIEMASLPTNTKFIKQIDEKPFSGGSKFKNGDTLFARITPCLENGKTGKVTNLKDEIIGHGSTEFIVMSAKEPEFDEDYIYYFARLPEFREFAQQRMVGTSGRQRVAWQDLADFEFIFPPKEQRKKAAALLNIYDQKIDLNTQINQTLEQIAQALFKSWFVDFDPVRAKVQALSDGLSPEQAELAAMQAISGKTPEELTALSQTQPDRYAELAETAKAFPCEMVEVDGVEVPKGWKTIPFKDFIKEKKEKVGSLKNIPEYSVTNNGIIPRSQKFNKQLSKNPEKNKLLHKTDLVFGMSREILNWGIMVDDIGSVSSAYHVYSIDKNVINHLYLKMMMMNKFQYFNELIRPSSREGQSFDKELLKEKTVISPSNFLLDHFLYKLELLNHQINTIEKETKTLISIRDTLLPELLNGKI